MGSLLGLVVNLWQKRKNRRQQQQFEERLARDYSKLSGLELDPAIDWAGWENRALLKQLRSSKGEGNGEVTAKKVSDQAGGHFPG